MSVIKSIHQKFRLRTTLVIPFVLQIVAAAGLIGYLSFRSGQQAVNDLARQLRSEITARVRERINNYVQIPILVNQVNVQAVDLGTLDFQNLEAAQPYLWRQVQVFKSIGYVGLANSQGQYFRIGWINRPAEQKNSQTGEQLILDSFATEKPQIAEQLNIGIGDLKLYNIDKDGQRTDLVKATPNYDVRNRPLYKTAVDKGKPVWSEINGNFLYPTLQMNISHPYYDQNRQLLGVLICQIGLNQVRDFLGTLKVGHTGQVYIIEPSGNLVATSVKDQPLWVKASKELQRINVLESRNQLIQASAQFLTKQFTKLKDIRQDYQFEFMLKGQRQFLQISPFTDEYGLNWLIVVVVPESDFMEQINANNENTIRLCLLALVLAIAIGIFTTSLITQPILRLTQASKELAKGNLDQQVETKDAIKIDEIETLEQSFNSMAAQLKASFTTLETQKETLAYQNAELVNISHIISENLRMSAELNVTRKLQQMMLPKQSELAAIEGLEIIGFMSPANEVGGDYYDVLQHNGSVKIGIGDVTGHGLESSTLMLMAQTAIRTLLESNQTDPVKFLDVLNRTLYGNIQRMDSQKNMTLVLLDYVNGMLNLSGQHEEIIIVRSDGEVEIIDTISLGFPIGLEEDIADLIFSKQVQLNPGDVVLLYTDGITEAENINKELYGLERLMKVARNNHQHSVEEIKQAILNDVRQHIGLQKVFDDITLVVLKQK